MEDKINKIKSNKNLTSQEKYHEIQKLYNNRNIEISNKINNSVSITNEDLVEECEHYTNKCYIYCKICEEYYKCFRCHDSNTTKHKIDRNNDITQIKCTVCYTEQTPSNQCIKCENKFAHYNCLKCNLWTSSTHEISHCDKCKICRVGVKDELYHCDNCSMCIHINSKDTHKCDIYNTDDCPICYESLFDNQDSSRVLECKHLIHVKCLNKYIEEKLKKGNIPNCLLCKKSIILNKEIELYFDTLSSSYLFNDEVDKWINEIKCNDCEEKCEIKYHLFYNKCVHCNSYNTQVLKTLKES